MESEDLTSAPLGQHFSSEDLSPLEQDVLDEYERLAKNMIRVVLPISNFMFVSRVRDFLG